MNIQQALDFAQSEISGEQAHIDARYLLSFILQKNFSWLKTWPEKLLSEDQQTTLNAMVTRRKNGEPVAYITGEKEFWTLRLETNSSTLIPRPETELLVEKAIEFLTRYKKANVLDLGTGTGAIALAIASERKNDKIFASDYQAGAVELAQRNARLNNLKNVTILQSDWYSDIEKFKYELIVSNPPYVASGDPHLSQGDLIFEPESALVSGENGLSDINIIISQAKDYLIAGGKLMIEHGFEQGDEVRQLFEQYGYDNIETICDLSGLDRITMGSMKC